MSEQTSEMISGSNLEKIFSGGHFAVTTECGPGNSSQVLLQRWPEAKLVGLDNSPAMIEKAKKDYPDQEWILSDAASYESDIKFDVIFSNAAIQ